MVLGSDRITATTIIIIIGNGTAMQSQEAEGRKPNSSVEFISSDGILNCVGKSQMESNNLRDVQQNKTSSNFILIVSSFFIVASLSLLLPFFCLPRDCFLLYCVVYISYLAIFWSFFLFFFFISFLDYS